MKRKLENYIATLKESNSNIVRKIDDPITNEETRLALLYKYNITIDIIRDLEKLVKEE